MLFILLNTRRKPVRDTDPNAGAVLPFITSGPRMAAGFSRKGARDMREFGFPVPAFVARLLGYRVRELF